MAAVGKKLLKQLLAVLLIALVPCSCSHVEPQVLHPGVEQLENEGMPGNGQGLPPGAKPPPRETVPAHDNDLPLMEKYQYGTR
jgi:hypothetical protein